MTRTEHSRQGPLTSGVSVRHHVAGGQEHGGGIGRLVGYIMDAQGASDRHRMQDTRGPRFRPLRSGVMLLGAIGALVGDRIFASGRVQHFHIAGRGSTARKLILSAVARVLGLTYVMHLHDFDYATDFQRRPAWQQSAIRRMFRMADQVIVLGARDQTTALDLLHVPQDRITILRNCVPDPGPVAPRDNPACRIVFLGQLGERKGVPELLDALCDPAMRNVEWTATLAGGGPVEDYRTRVRAFGLADRVSLPGWLTETQARALCTQGDILVLPSHGEGMAMAVIEGLAHGMAVVTTRVGAHDEVLTDNETCLFVPVGDAHALAQTLARLVTDPALRMRIGDAGRDLYLTRMEISDYVARLSRLYGDLSRNPYPHKRELA